MINGTYRFSFTSKNPLNFKKIRNIILWSLLGIFVLVGVLTSFYTVDDKQQAVVTTFGKVTDITEPGLHFKAPFGIQQAHKVDINVYQKIELGYTTNADGSTTTTTTAATTTTTKKP